MTTPRYQELTDDLSHESAAGVLKVYAAMQAGALGPTAATAAMAAVINTANAAAVSLAAVFVAATIEGDLRKPTPPSTVAVAPVDDTERLTAAVATILDPAEPAPVVRRVRPDPELVEATEADVEAIRAEIAAEGVDDVAAIRAEIAADGDAAMQAAIEEELNRLERLARSEPLRTGQETIIRIVNRLPVVTGWVRKLDANPCSRCRRWAEDGRVFSSGTPFKRHFGCNCQPEIVVRTPSETEGLEEL